LSLYLPPPGQNTFSSGLVGGDHFDMGLYNDVAEDMMWVDVTLELAKEIFMIWKCECEFQGELAEDLDDAL